MTREECIEAVKDVEFISDLSTLGFVQCEEKERITEDTAECDVYVWRHIEHKLVIVVEHMGLYGCNVISVSDLEDCVCIDEKAYSTTVDKVSTFSRGLAVVVGLAVLAVVLVVGIMSTSNIVSNKQQTINCIVSDLRISNDDNKGSVSYYKVTLFSTDKRKPGVIEEYVNRGIYSILSVGDEVVVSIDPVGDDGCKVTILPESISGCMVIVN